MGTAAKASLACMYAKRLKQTVAQLTLHRNRVAASLDALMSTLAAAVCSTLVPQDFTAPMLSLTSLSKADHICHAQRAVYSAWWTAAVDCLADHLYSTCRKAMHDVG